MLVDVREYPEFAAGRVAGAKLIPLGHLERRLAEVDRERPVYVVCRTGRRSAEARRKLVGAGFGDVRDVRGGIVAWEHAGFELERDPRAPWALERQVRLVAGAIVLVGVLLAVFVDDAFVWLAGFVGAGLVVAALTDTCAMGMMLAKLPWNRESATSAAADDGESGTRGTTTGR
jgi:rhodanese-related sulfurtransferase